MVPNFFLYNNIILYSRISKCKMTSSLEDTRTDFIIQQLKNLARVRQKLPCDCTCGSVGGPGPASRASEIKS